MAQKSAERTLYTHSQFVSVSFLLRDSHLPSGELLQWTLNKGSSIDLPAGGEVKEVPLLL